MFNSLLTVITPRLTGEPTPHRTTALILAQDYRLAAEKAGVEPDEELLRPIVEVLQAMPADSGDGEALPES